MITEKNIVASIGCGAVLLSLAVATFIVVVVTVMVLKSMGVL